jgi:hypothetical protein
MVITPDWSFSSSSKEMRPCMDDQFRHLEMEDGNFVPQYGAPRFVFILSGDVKLGWDS